MTAKVVKTTSKGQITLPAKWRSQFDTDNFTLEMKKNRLVVKPLYLDMIEEEIEEEGWTTIWSSERDNGGKGIPAEEMIRMIKKIRNEQGREIPPEIK